jgi:hypothetical protein
MDVDMNVDMDVDVDMNAQDMLSIVMTVLQATAM